MHWGMTGTHSISIRCKGNAAIRARRRSGRQPTTAHLHCWLVTASLFSQYRELASSKTSTQHSRHIQRPTAIEPCFCHAIRLAFSSGPNLVSHPNPNDPEGTKPWRTDSLHWRTSTLAVRGSLARLLPTFLDGWIFADIFSFLAKQPRQTSRRPPSTHQQTTSWLASGQSSATMPSSLLRPARTTCWAVTRGM